VATSKSSDTESPSDGSRTCAGAGAASASASNVARVLVRTVTPLS
jgi:hypothetical protein